MNIRFILIQVDNCGKQPSPEKLTIKNLLHPPKKPTSSVFCNVINVGTNNTLYYRSFCESSKDISSNGFVAVALCFSCKICEHHQCICGEMVSKSGNHGLSCNRSVRFSRHSEKNKILMAVTSAGFFNIWEPPGISRSDGKNRMVCR